MKHLIVPLLLCFPTFAYADNSCKLIPTSLVCDEASTYARDSILFKQALSYNSYVLVPMVRADHCSIAPDNVKVVKDGTRNFNTKIGMMNLVHVTFSNVSMSHSVDKYSAEGEYLGTKESYRIGGWTGVSAIHCNGSLNPEEKRQLIREQEFENERKESEIESAKAAKDWAEKKAADHAEANERAKELQINSSKDGCGITAMLDCN